MTEVLAIGREMDRAVAEWMGDDLRVFDAHEWKLDEKGEIDEFATECDNHNGPMCVRCGYGFCKHCNPNGYDVEPCEITFSYYSTSIDAAVRVWHELAKRGVYLFMGPSSDGRWQYSEPGQLSVFCDTLPEAICRTVLERGQ